MENFSPKVIWDLYTESWSEPDQAKRIKMFEICLSPDCVYTDSVSQIVGYQQLSSYLSELQKKSQGFSLINRNFKNYQDWFIANWDMLNVDGILISQGTSLALCGGDGRLKKMARFMEAPNKSAITGSDLTPTGIEKNDSSLRLLELEPMDDGQTFLI